MARAGRVRYAVATGGNASWNSEARCRRSPALANTRRDYLYSSMNADEFGTYHTPQKRVENRSLLLNSRVSPFVPAATLNFDLQFGREGSAKSYVYSANPVFGITSFSEFGVTFGYQRQNGDGDDANGTSDLILETNRRLIGTATNLFKLSMQFDLKLPTASERLELGTGEPDADIILIATGNGGKTYLDWYIGYTAVDTAHSNFNDGR